MGIKDIQERLLTLLVDTGNKGLSYNEIVGQLNLVRKEKSLLSEALQGFIECGKLEKRNRKYRLIDTNLKDKHKNTATSKPGLIEGLFDATPLSRNQSFAFVRTEQGDFFIGAEDTLNAYHDDLVSVEPHYRNGKANYAHVRRIIKRANETLAGDIRIANGKTYFLCTNPKIHNWFEVSDLNSATDGNKVVLQVTNWGNPLSGKMPVGKVIEVLGLSGDPQVELMGVICQYKLPLEFPDSVLSETESFSDQISAEELRSRKDFRDLFTFTIDPISAKDFDDAISLEKLNNGWRLYVHIADVAHYVKMSGSVFAEAVKRGNSFYFPKKVIPMLPERLSNKICSLRPWEDKLTLTIITDFNTGGKITKQQLVESVICSDQRLSYEEVDAFFEGNNSDLSEQLQQSLNNARELSALLTDIRLRNGYIFFDLPELEYEYDNEGFIKRLTLADETESHKIIENFMLVANEYIAKKLTELSPTTLYRIHEDPDPTKLQRVVELLSHYGVSFYQRDSLNASIQYLLYSMPDPDYHKVFDRIILRSLKKAKYSTEHIRHFGLGMEDYTHFTSPIRRLCDLVIHHLCKIHILHSSKEKISPTQLKRFASIATEQELQADQAERDIERIYSLAYMKGHIGESFSGMVISAKSTGLIIHLNEIPVNAILQTAQLHGRGWQYLEKEMRYVNIYTNDYYQLLDKVLVNIIDVSDDIYAELRDSSDAHIHVFQNPTHKKMGLSKTTSNLKKGSVKRIAIDDKRARRKIGQAKRKQRGEK